MALHFLAWELMVLEERVNFVNRRIQRRMLRDASNPFELPGNEFTRTFRLTQDVAMMLVNTLRPFLQRRRVTGLSPEIQVLVAVNFYAHGSYQRPTGDRFDFSVSPTTVSRCLHVVTDLINQHMLRRWVKFPVTNEERQAARMKFQNAPQPFYGAIGAIDCTYVNILAPAEHEDAFVNHHHNHSLNVQAIVDPQMKVLNINARYPGARNDAYIWSVSPIRRVMETKFNQGERHTWLIGDAGYPLEPWLMTPLNDYPPGTRQYQYTEDLCRARNVVERFFGVFKGTWRCMSYQRVLMYAPAFAGRMVNACAVLHNIRIHHNLRVEPYLNEDEVLAHQYAVQHQGDIMPDVPRQGENPRAIALRVQQRMMQQQYRDLPDGDRL